MSKDDLEAAARLFELELGRDLPAEDHKRIRDAGLSVENSSAIAGEIKKLLLDPKAGSEYRSLAYWALGKRHDAGNLDYFRQALRREVGTDMNVAYQIMIALDNLEEPVFGRDRQGYAAMDSEHNKTDALAYLEAVFGE